ncbi:hypothetical protein QQF64_018404 [Cirrhinus molitorella]|uniref:L1 transposable element RRM domain-containing protein n=1 Tax=Cirrhinus molitorella TaxID=172907 RepID=A0ABR3LGG3_9TELE
MSQKQSKRDTKAGKNDDGKSTQKQLTLDASVANVVSPEAKTDTGGVAALLSELRKFRQESGDAQRDIIESQTRLETSMTEIKQQISQLEEMTTVEGRVSNTEDKGIRQERALAYLLKRDTKLAARQDDLENRLRRNNIRVYGIPEDAEGKAMIPFITGFFKTALKLQEDLIISLERAHRATTPKPKSSAPPRSIIVRFLDLSVKQVVLQQAWKQRDIEYQGKKVYFDQDYSPEVVRKRKQVREVIKKLRERNIKAQALYPAQLKIFLETGVKTFGSLGEAQSTLTDLGVTVDLDDRDKLERELLRDSWSTQGNQRKRGFSLSPGEIRDIMKSVEQH